MPQDNPGGRLDVGEVRRQQLETALTDMLEQLKAYEDQLRLTDDPDEIKKCEKKIERIKTQLKQDQTEYDQLCAKEAISSPLEAVGEPFTSALVAKLPYPLAAPCQAYNESQDGRTRFLLLDKLLQNSVKYLAAAALAEYRHANRKSPHLRQWLTQISRRYLRDWLLLLEDLKQHAAETTDHLPLAKSLFAMMTQPLANESAITNTYFDLGRRMELEEDSESPITAEQFLLRLTSYRELAWEAGDLDLPPAFYQALIPILQPALAELLDTIPLMSKYRLRFAERAIKTKTGWEYEMASWRGSDPHPDRRKPHEVRATGDTPPHKPYRLYLCTPAGEPLVNLHPLIVHFRDFLYFLESTDLQDNMVFSPCFGGGLLRPTPQAQRSLMSLSSFIDEQVNEVSGTLDDIESEIESQERADDVPLASLVGQLDAAAVEALQIALGESLRIGHFWLGVEFLLMGLSKQAHCRLPALLIEIGLDPGELRAALRGLVGVRPDTEKTWRHANVMTVGAEVWDQLQVIDPATLAADVAAGKTPQAAITPRMLAVLRGAVQLAGEGKAAPDHLLLAAMQYPHTLPVTLLLGQVAEAGQDPRQWLAELQAQVVGSAAAPPNGEPQHPKVIEDGAPAGAARPAVPRVTRGKDLLGTLGRDLTALAQAQPPQLHPAIGQAARKAMGQMGQILLQAQGNNPILLGDPGVGKTAIVEGFAWRLANDPNVVPQLAGRRIVDLPPTALVASTKYRGDLEQRLQQVLAEVRAANRQTIIFIDEIHTILGGKAEGGLGAISDALKPALARGEFPCIGATTVPEYRRYIESDPALARRFTPVWIEEPSDQEAIQIAKTVAEKQLTPRHGVIYPDETVEEAVQLAVRYLHDEFLPGKAIKLLDQAGPRVVMGGSLSGPQAGDTASGGEVSVDTVRAIVAERTGIPVTRLGEDDRARLKALEGRLKARVKGQDQAVQAVVAAVKRARTGMGDPNRPQGVLLFAGPTGVGKTELALALAEALFDDEHAIVRLDMSEYLEKHQVSRLIGSPPGYIGHEEEGQLTGRLRRRPYSVVLLDEIEKAHPDVQHLFLQLFDAGRLTDSRGRLADGRNAFFIMTTNLGTRDAMGFISEPATYEAKLKKAVEDHFTPEFRNRIQRTIYFRPLDQAMLMVIFDKLFARAAARFRAQGIVVEVDDALKAELCQQAVSSKEGARPLERAIEDEIVTPLVDGLLDGKIGRDQHVVIGLDRALTFGEIPKAPVASQPEGAPAARLPAEPEANQVGLDPREVHNRATLAPLLAALNRQLQSRQITLTLAESVIELLCSPFWQNERRGLGTGQAFAELVEKPLLEQVQRDVFQEGHQVEAYRDLALAIVFRTLEGDRT